MYSTICLPNTKLKHLTADTECKKDTIRNYKLGASCVNTHPDSLRNVSVDLHPLLSSPTSSYLLIFWYSGPGGLILQIISLNDGRYPKGELWPHLLTAGAGPGFGHSSSSTACQSWPLVFRICSL